MNPEEAMSERELEEKLEEQKQTWLWKTGSADTQTRGGYIEGINDAKAIVRRSHAEAAELRERVEQLEEAVGEVLRPRSYRVEPDGKFWVYMSERLENLLTDALSCEASATNKSARRSPVGVWKNQR